MLSTKKKKSGWYHRLQFSGNEFVQSFCPSLDTGYYSTSTLVKYKFVNIDWVCLHFAISLFRCLLSQELVQGAVPLLHAHQMRACKSSSLGWLLPAIGCFFQPTGGDSSPSNYFQIITILPSYSCTYCPHHRLGTYSKGRIFIMISPFLLGFVVII